MYCHNIARIPTFARSHALGCVRLHRQYVKQALLLSVNFKHLGLPLINSLLDDSPNLAVNQTEVWAIRWRQILSNDISMQYIV